MFLCVFFSSICIRKSLGTMIQVDLFFPTGLKPPTSYSKNMICCSIFLFHILSSFLLSRRVVLAGAEFFCWAPGHDFLLAWICFLFVSWCYLCQSRRSRSAYGYSSPFRSYQSDGIAKLQFLKTQFAPYKRVFCDV